jgi:hypothetical protein
MIFLSWAPATVSLILGSIYLVTVEGRLTTKLVGTGVFITAALLQFGSAYPLAGLLLQVGLAMCLVVWRRLDEARR